jgi:RHS repeat-associated protein
MERGVGNVIGIAAPNPPLGVLTEEMVCEYDTSGTSSGHPSLVVRKEYNGEGGRDWYHAVDLQYNSSGELWFVTQRHWPVDDVDCWYQVRDRVTEFRGSGRGRYMVRERRRLYEGWIKPGTTRWTDYDGDEIYGDYRVSLNDGLPENVMGYLPGVGELDLQLGDARYYHADHMGTLRVVSGAGGVVWRYMVYTAFGEVVWAGDGWGNPVPPEGNRYQYAGEWGYESGLLNLASPPGAPSTPVHHVGYRWYDPSAGRFLERDPMGTLGGLNTYVYANNNPLMGIDPFGLTSTPPPLLGPPRRTGPGGVGMFDSFWTKVHYTFGVGAGLLDLTFPKTTCLAIRWEFFEPGLGVSWQETRRNQIGDIIAAQMGWFDGQRLRPVIRNGVLLFGTGYMRGSQRAIHN